MDELQRAKEHEQEDGQQGDDKDDDGHRCDNGDGNLATHGNGA